MGVGVGLGSGRVTETQEAKPWMGEAGSTPWNITDDLNAC